MQEEYDTLFQYEKFLLELHTEVYERVIADYL